MPTNSLQPSHSRPDRSIGGSLAGAAVVVVVASIALKVVLGIVFGLLSLVVPIVLAAVGFELWGRGHARSGGAVLALAALILIF